MNQQFRLPVLRSIMASMIVLILAVSFTLLSFASQGSEPVNVGNLCGVNQDEPCLVSIPKAGWPLPYLVDRYGTSALGVLGLEDFRIMAFLLEQIPY